MNTVIDVNRMIKITIYDPKKEISADVRVAMYDAVRNRGSFETDLDGTRITLVCPAHVASRFSSEIGSRGIVEEVDT